MHRTSDHSTSRQQLSSSTVGIECMELGREMLVYRNEEQGQEGVTRMGRKPKMGLGSML